MTYYFDTSSFLKNTNLFWQYPVKTELAFYEQNKYNPNYLGIPWATIIDKRVNTMLAAKYIIPYLMKHVNYYTCCQHIKFREIIPLLQLLKVRTLYTPHKKIGENEISGIRILPCPLYAVNVEDTTRNSHFINKDFNTCERELLYSFMGGMQSDANYISDIRNKIFNMEHDITNTVIINTHKWHFNSIVYSHLQNKNGDLNMDIEHVDNTNKYNELLLNSRYSLCPSGTGPNSIRFWESLAVGSIPVLLSDDMELPYGHDWDNAIIRIKESDLGTLLDVLNTISVDRERELRKNCIEIYNKLKTNYISCKQNIIHYCCGSYNIMDFGGVARYDYQLSLVFPHRIFIKGPEQKNLLMYYCTLLTDIVVITDNHLACDVPNKYKVVLVHHGSALTHADREPGWNIYWKELCCTGQKKMLYLRNVDTTDIVSCSTFCIDEFMKYFPDVYPKFNCKLILHTSELNNKVHKTRFNDEPRIFGNFATEIKGLYIYEKLKKEYPNIHIETLNIKYNPAIHKSIADYNNDKQLYYMQRDIFLQLSGHEGNSYATLDAFLCGNVVVATDVGLTYKDVPEDCYVKLDYTKVNDVNYVIDKLNYAWNNRILLSRNARNYFMEHCNFTQWKNTMYNMINSS
jgi:hypothetical protein